MDNVGALLSYLKREPQHPISQKQPVIKENKKETVKITEDIPVIEIQKEKAEITQVDKILNAASMLKGNSSSKKLKNKIVELW